MGQITLNVNLKQISFILVFSFFGYLNTSAQVTGDYVTVDFNGFNSDVIANGIGPAANSTTATVDASAAYVFMSEDWKANASDPATGVGLPSDGIIIDQNNTNIQFQLKPFDQNNSLRIGEFDIQTATITFNDSFTYSDLYLLVNGGNGSPTIDVTFNFTDGTSEVISGTVPDWFNGTPYVQGGFGRVQRATDLVETPANNPRFYRVDLNISTTNEGKVVDEIIIERTSPAGDEAVFNLYAISGRIGDCANPYEVTTFDIGPTEASFTWDFEDEPTGWEALLYNGGSTPPTASTSGFAFGPTTTVLTGTGLTPNMTYDFYVRRNCGNGNFSDWVSVSFTTGLAYIYENGSWSPQNPVGVSTLIDNVSIVNGTTTLTGDLDAHNLTIDNGATLNIENVLQLDGDLTINGDLVFVSDATNTGILGPLPNWSIVTGEATVERYIQPRRAFRFVSSPVETTTSIRENWQENPSAYNNNPSPGYGTHITGVINDPDGTNGFDFSPSGNPSMYGFDNQTKSWFTITNTNSNTLTIGEPWRLMVRGGRDIDVTSNATPPTITTLRAKGSLEVGELSFTDFTATAGDYNFIGNPYQCPVNVDLLLRNSTNIDTGFYYVWDPFLGGNPTVGQPGGRGAFVTVDLSDGSNTSGSDANGFIQPWQGIFVRTGTEGIAPELIFNETLKDTDPTSFTSLFRSANASKSIHIKLYTQDAFANAETASDGLKINFGSEFNSEVDIHDATKPGNLDENLARIQDDNYLSIEYRAEPQQDEELQLFTSNYRYSDYVFEVEIQNLDNTEVYLKDNYLETQVLLTSGNNQAFFQIDESIEASIDTNRFSIVFGEENLNNKDFDISQSIKLYPNPVENQLQVVLPDNIANEMNIHVVNILGQMVYQKDFENAINQVSINTSSFANGVYILSLIAKDGKKFQSKFIKN